MVFSQQERVAKLSTEFVGTLFLCLTIALTAKSSSIAAIVIGCALMVVVYSGGHISGGHYNPAVTLAVLLRGGGKIGLIDSGLFMVAQFAGALSGAVLSWPLIGRSMAGYPALGATTDPSSAVLVELMISLALCSVVLHTATTQAQANNSYYGLAIGWTVLSGAISVGGVSGGAFNPAVGLMPILYGSDAAANSWVYFAGPFAAGILAAIFFRVSAPEEYTDSPQERQLLIAQAAVEMFGTMMLCFTVGTAAGNGSFLAPLAIGSMLMVMIYMGGAVSGGHLNPAVTLGILLRTFWRPMHDIFSWQKAFVYLVAQILGSAIGTLAAVCAMNSSSHAVGHPALPEGSSVGAGILGELLGTFLLVYVVLNVGTVKQLAGNSFFGIAIGMVVTAMACAIGPVSGGALNPAVGLVGIFSGGAGGSKLIVWIYWVGCPAGAMLASCFFRIQNFMEFCADQPDPKFLAHADHDPKKTRFVCHAHPQTSKDESQVQSGASA
eukprot:TRINITY_DN6291_c0_g1_i1.p1 TRINITY_DN6291_c0_g1~~TRINITY_DN6291_c0_g1_i1.p1  ORF type:complete len:494 (+),score=82.95 TRINITY_DN6291_c0_g1_i1:72-1553(+)